MGHGTVADEIKGRPHGRRPRGRDPRHRGGGRALSLLPGRWSASWAPRPRWRSRPRSARTSRSSSTSARPFTSTATTPSARRSAPTAGCARCLDWHARARPAGQLVYGIVQGGVYEDLRVALPAVAASEPRRASPSAARWARTRRRCTRSWAGRSAELDRRAGAAATPARASATSTTSSAASSWASTPSTAPCPRAWAPRLALIPDPPPLARGPARAPLTRPRSRSSRAARARPARRVLPRLLRYLVRAQELTGMRLLTLHNLTFMARLMPDLREAIHAGSARGQVGDALRAGARACSGCRAR